MNTSFNISGKLDAGTLEIIDRLTAVCAAMDIEILLVGAAARDIHFLHVHEISPDHEATGLDFALLVPSWDAFNEVMTEITSDRKFTRDRKMKQRVYSPAGMMFDLIPFGGIEEPEGKISWPPDFDQVNSTTGFQDALDSAQFCRVMDNPSKKIRVASIPGIAVLKLLAWAEQHPDSSEDAIDFRFVLENYDAGQIDRLFSKEENLTEVVNSEYEMAVAQLLGRDAGSMMSAKTRQAVLGILEAEQNVDGQLQLVSDLLIDSVQGAEYVLEQLKHFHQGILDISSGGAEG